MSFELTKLKENLEKIANVEIKGSLEPTSLKIIFGANEKKGITNQLYQIAKDHFKNTIYECCAPLIISDEKNLILEIDLVKKENLDQTNIKELPTKKDVPIQKFIDVSNPLEKEDFVKPKEIAKFPIIFIIISTLVGIVWMYIQRFRIENPTSGTPNVQK
jgi:hypothetical protein